MRSVQAEIQLSGSWLPLGTLRSETKRGAEYGSFGYSAEYLGEKEAYPVDPRLPMSSGSYSAAGSLHGAFRDAAPDRWGRNLIERAFRAKKPLGTISELDFLLGVSEASRIGNFRFQDHADFMQIRHEIPTMVTLPRVLRLSEELVDSDDYRITKELLEVGSASLGGARPKSSVVDNGILMIAKFSHAHDHWDVMAWESWSLNLARQFGLLVSVSRLINVSGKGVLILDRFDRIGSQRIGYISAMTLLGKNDGDQADYLELADAITAQGTNVTDQLRELWRRVLLSIAIRNTDDHLRNHGFLRVKGGWTLSPVFDINPNPLSNSGQRSTSFAGAVGIDSELDSLLEFASYFGFQKSEAVSQIRAIAELLTKATKAPNLPNVKQSEKEQMLEVFSSALSAFRQI
jgi:serine/threonine-protein kinase HipA